MPYFVVVRERRGTWDWSLPLRRQAEWEAHAAFMDALAKDGFVLAGGPLGDEDRARRVMHVVEAANEDAIGQRLADDPWTLSGMLQTVNVEPWTVLLGGFSPPR